LKLIGNNEAPCAPEYIFDTQPYYPNLREPLNRGTQSPSGDSVMSDAEDLPETLSAAEYYALQNASQATLSDMSAVQGRVGESGSVSGPSQWQCEQEGEDEAKDEFPEAGIDRILNQN
jgi:hypothetical protein